MKMELLRAASGSRLTLSSSDHQMKEDRLVIVICEDKSALAIPVGISTIFCPLFGSSEVFAGTWKTELKRGDISVSDTQLSHEICVYSGSIAVAILGAQHTWLGMSKLARRDAWSISSLFPAIHRNVPALCRRILRLARDYQAEPFCQTPNQFARHVLQLIDDLQSKFDELIARCPGSSGIRKKSVFMRLQRARNLISHCSNEDLDIAKLALTANYSVGHFITIFRLVFGETPYASISRHRLKSAERSFDAERTRRG